MRRLIAVCSRRMFVLCLRRAGWTPAQCIAKPTPRKGRMDVGGNTGCCVPTSFRPFFWSTTREEHMAQNPESGRKGVVVYLTLEQDALDYLEAISLGRGTKGRKLSQLLYEERARREERERVKR